jgi:polysaccharide transporter, PST family
MELYKTVRTFWLKGEAKKITANISWLSFDKLFRLIISLSVGIWFARYLGPEKYGTFTYALSITGLLAFLSSLGLNDIVIREIVKSPEKKHEFIGTVFLLKTTGGIIAYLLCIIIISIIEPDDIFVRLLVAIMGLQLIMSAFDVVELWFISQVNSKKAVLAKSVAFFLISLAKIYLILSKAPLISFAYLTAAGSVLIALALMAVYQFDGEKSLKWKVNSSVAKRLLNDSWPLIFAGLSVSIYMKIDQVMVGNILGDFALGNYAVAVKLTETWYFLPTVIVASVYPSIIKYKEQSNVRYLKRLQQLYFLMTWLAIGIALPTSFLSGYFINMLFGVQYAAASPVLILYVWSAIPVFLGVASSAYLTTENLNKITLFRTVLGAVVNVFMNLLLIPLLGLMGAAISTLISYNISTFYIFALKRTRQQAMMMVRSFNPCLPFENRSYKGSKP